MKDNLFSAACSADIRWRDAVIIAARGPLIIDVGGTFGDEFYPIEKVSWIDGLTVTKTWVDLANAQAWQSAIEARMQIAMADLRALYAEFPGDFADRTRTI